MTTIAAIRRNALRSLIPPPRLRLSDWIEANIKLPEGVSALPGAVRLWPYQREIADAISDPEIERVTLVKPVRVGFTRCSLAQSGRSLRMSRARFWFCCRPKAMRAITSSPTSSRSSRRRRRCAAR